jgi:hypothetical protein
MPYVALGWIPAQEKQLLYSVGEGAEVRIRFYESTGSMSSLLNLGTICGYVKI